MPDRNLFFTGQSYVTSPPEFIVKKYPRRPNLSGTDQREDLYSPDSRPDENPHKVIPSAASPALHPYPPPSPGQQSILTPTPPHLRLSQS